MGPLLTGMKVAFHTSVYGIFFSLVFNFIYRGIMADAYEKLQYFLDVFRQCAQPVAMSEDENSAAMLVYQANMANAMKQMLELMKGEAKVQTEGVERIVECFVEQMNAALGVNLQKLGTSLKETSASQAAYAAQSEKLVETTLGMVEVSRMTQKNLERMLEQQEAFAKELTEQKKMLETTCAQISDEVSSQLYTFDQMRSFHEK